MPDSMLIFDRQAVRRHRDRAASAFGRADFLFREAGERLADRLRDVVRAFPLALDLGCHQGALASALAATSKVERLIQCDISAAMIRGAVGAAAGIVADEEALPFAEASFDLVTSNLSLHWTNDLPGALIQARRALKPDGLLLANLFGGETLKELRACLLRAEGEVTGGASPRVSPFVDVRDAGMLLTRAGFALPVVDADVITVTYAEPLKLLADLRAMGETNALIERSRKPLRRDVLMRALDLYRDEFCDARGRAVATFQLVTLSAWAPHQSQQKALRPGSAQARLADALKTQEIALNDNSGRNQS